MNEKSTNAKRLSPPLLDDVDRELAVVLQAVQPLRGAPP